MSISLRAALGDYDGKTVATLEAIHAGCAGSAALLDELIDIAACEQAPPKVQAGATWLLRRYLQDGQAPTAAGMTRLAAGLGHLDDPWACLHLCQAMGQIAVPASEAEAFATFLRRCLEMSSKFVRAWAYDGFFRLGQQHQHFETEALSLLVKAQEEEAPSIRARVRKILAT